MNRGEKAILIGLVAAVLIAFTGFFDTCDSIDDNVLRLHILANSDSEEDQFLKLKVRDRLLRDVPEMFSKAESKSSAITEAEKHMDEIKQTIEDELRENGAEYGFSVQIVDGMYFENREYDGFTMPAGIYSALRICLGNAEGQNWWCVMYPPLCNCSAIKEEAFDKKQTAVLSANSDYEIKFKVCEIYSKAKKKLKKWFS